MVVPQKLSHSLHPGPRKSILKYISENLETGPQRNTCVQIFIAASFITSVCTGLWTGSVSQKGCASSASSVQRWVLRVCLLLWFNLLTHVNSVRNSVARSMSLKHASCPGPSLCSLAAAKKSTFLRHILPDWLVQSNGANQPWTETFKRRRSKESFFLFVSLKYLTQLWKVWLI